MSLPNNRNEKCFSPLSRGSAISKIIGTNAVLYPEFEDTVPMWVHEEQVSSPDLRVYVSLNELFIRSTAKT